MSTFTIVTGSHRQQGESTRIGGWVEGELARRGHTVHHINLSDIDLPLWDEGMWGVEGLSEKWADIWAPLQEKLAASDGLVCIAPEYAGMVPPKLKNFFLFPSQVELGNKPGLIMTVTGGGTNGAYPVAELRAHTVKNCKLVWLPEHIIVRNAAEEFTGEETYTVKRTHFALDVLEEYATALQGVRASGRVVEEEYPFGM